MSIFTVSKSCLPLRNVDIFSNKEKEASYIFPLLLVDIFLYDTFGYYIFYMNILILMKGYDNESNLAKIEHTVCINFLPNYECRKFNVLKF